MPVSIKTKQVASVTFLVGCAVVVLSGWYLSELGRDRLDETNQRAALVANTIYQRAFDAIASGVDPEVAVRTDPGLQSILKASGSLSSVVYVAITDVNGIAIAHNDPASVGRKIEPVDNLEILIRQGPWAQLRAITAKDGRIYEFSQRLVLASNDASGTRELGAIRVGVSTLLILGGLQQSMKAPAYTALAVLVIASIVAMGLAQVVLRPIHVIRSGLARLGRGELDVSVDLPAEGELAELGDSFKAVSARLAADRTRLEGQTATLASVVDHLEEAVALFAADGTLLFANPAMRATLSGSGSKLADLLPPDHPYRRAVDDTIALRQPQGPAKVAGPDGRDRLILTHMVEGADKSWLGVMLVARNLAALTEVESTLSYSRKLAALNRLSAGIAHEVKNPLNATMIHLELLKMQLQDESPAMEHLRVIAAQMRRLDEVVQGFLKFTRPADLELHPTALGPLVDELLPVIRAEAGKSGVDVKIEIANTVPLVSADAAMLQQAVLNLALNACQAMPNGGRLRIAAAARPGRRVEVLVEDSGTGIAPEQLERIFDLYYTTKEHGTGIGLSMVYRTVQLHDGDIEVQSVPGKGTTFRMLLREA